MTHTLTSEEVRLYMLYGREPICYVQFKAQYEAQLKAEKVAQELIDENANLRAEIAELKMFLQKIADQAKQMKE